MLKTSRPQPVDYLVIGHITRDISGEERQIGGSVMYSSLMAHALGLRTGIITSWSGSTLSIPETISIVSAPSKTDTTFENIETESGRFQYILQKADDILVDNIPTEWLKTKIVHLAPVAQELNPDIIDQFRGAFLGGTLQGWLRKWDDSGKVSFTIPPFLGKVLKRLNAIVISLEDVGGNEEIIEEMASKTRLLAVTEAEKGARLYWNGDVRRFRAPDVELVDSTGAGDIFAAAFFIRLNSTRDPWESARFAVNLASLSVTRRGLDSVPSQEEIQQSIMEVL